MPVNFPVRIVQKGIKEKWKKHIKGTFRIHKRKRNVQGMGKNDRQRKEETDSQNQKL